MSAVLLVSLSLSLSLAWLVAIGLSAVAGLVPPEQRLGARASTRLRALVALLPFLVGSIALVVVLLPSPLTHCHCIDHGAGHPHVCVHHPWLALPLTSFAAPVAVLWLGFALLRVRGVVRDLLRGERWARRLRALPPALIDDVPVRFVDGIGLGAFTVGLWRPVVVMDRALWQHLEPRERLAVLHHEHAHAVRGDTLTQACLRLINAVLPWSMAHARWLSAWRSATELACDRHAALKVQDATSVAKALVSVERLRSNARSLHELAPAVAMAAGRDLAPRVRVLLGELPVEPPPLSSDLRPIAVGLLAFALLLVAWPGAALHHAAESLLGFLTHH
jgi:Zn-dependent protease with chaperone function